MIRQSSLYTTQEDYSLEYSVAGHGHGATILVMHGGHSNSNEEFGYEELVGEGYQILTPSRPGYGRTSKELGRNLSAACQAYIELLDFLSIEQVHVLSMSAGGPSGIVMASEHPKRVRSLILQSAITHEFLTPTDKAYKASKIMFHPQVEKYLWSAVGGIGSLFPKYLFKRMASSFSKLGMDELLPQISNRDIQEFKKMIKRQRSGHGFLLDLTQTNVIDSDLMKIRCPALILHSVNDSTVPEKHAHFAHRHIENSELSLLDSWGHLIWIGEGSKEMYHILLEFLDRHTLAPNTCPNS